MEDSHILLVTFPGQGHINPSLQFAKRLVRIGFKVTFATSLSFISRVTKTTPTLQGLEFASFSDGYDDGITLDDDLETFMSDFRVRGSQAVAELINDGAITYVVYTTLLPWVAEVARDLHIPSTLLWIQPVTVLDIYYFDLNGYGDVIRSNSNDLSSSIQLPGLPLLTIGDLPSFLLPSNSHKYALPLYREHLHILDAETNPLVLVNTIDALEHEPLRAIQKFNMIAVGPLIPSGFLDGKDQNDTSSVIDLFQKSSDYVQWLKSKPESSVVYVSFGSISILSKQQKEEIAHGLLESHRPFLWVVRESGKQEDDDLSCREELEEQGMIVPWCSQVEVLSHPSLGCFVTHCGWNSSLESLVSGVPMVAFPQWTDQGTNAKLIVDVWKTGVRVTAEEGGLVRGDEIKRCIEMVMGSGEKGEEMRRNAKKWKDMAREAVKEGGSTDMNLKTFVAKVGSCQKIK